MLPKSRKRNQDIRIRVTAEVMARTQRVAQLLGMPPSTLASLALAQYISQQERGLLIVDKMADAIGGEMGNALKEEMQRVVEASPAVQQKLFPGPGRRKKGKRG